MQISGEVMKYFLQILVTALLISLGDVYGQSALPGDNTQHTSQIKQLKDVIDFYPNPSRGSFKLNIRENGIEEFNLSIYDLNGSVVFEKVFKGLFAGITFDLKLKKPGLYIIKINTGADQLIEKMLISP